MSSTSERADFDIEEITDRLKQRQEAVEGGARYRQTSRDTTDGTPSVNTECQNCGAHVGRRYVRVMGLDGMVYACPECSDTSDNLNGATAGRLRRETL